MSLLATDLRRLQRALQEVRVRYARDAEATAIAQMVHSSHEAVPVVSWAKVYPYWLVAEYEQEAVGCVQLCFSAPIGRMEFLSFIPNLPHRTRALSVKALLNFAALALKRDGATAIAGCLAHDQKGFKEILKAEGCKVLMSANVIGRAVS